MKGLTSIYVSWVFASIFSELFFLLLYTIAIAIMRAYTHPGLQNPVD